MTDYKAIFQSALDIRDEIKRAEYLNEACGNDVDLREQVDSLLDAHAKAVGFMDVSKTTEGMVGLVEGESVGNYKLREKIGEGGMGVVYIAEQTAPVRRKVALKIIKPGMDTREVVARFEAERQALALMDHPNIAKVHDGGATKNGRPFFVMELVRGQPITEFCDKARLKTNSRLELFVTVAQAIQHAHRKGIIHRDIKPSNVLVSLHDDRPVVKVIDFGVAKAVNQHLTELSVYTRFQQIIGTPLYMSPEQAELSGLDIDTRTDVYSLGVLLYELLTGFTPFDRQHFARAAYDEMRRIIREEEPQKPSTRVSSLSNEEQSLVAERRASSPGKLSQQLKGELDWILTRALEKDRRRRYDSASGFASDVERYLRNEPVEAAAPSVLYRLRKFVARRKALAATTAIVCASLLLGTVGTAWQAVRARASQVRALRNLYTSDMEEAKRELDASNTRRSFNLLEKYCQGQASDFRGFEWFWMWNQFHRNGEFRLVGHTGEVRCVRFSPNGKLLATGATDGTLRLWDIATQKELWKHKGGTHCNSIDFSSNGTRLLANYYAPLDEGTVVWDVSDPKKVVRATSLPPGTIRFPIDDQQRLVRSGRPTAIIDAKGTELHTIDVGSHRIRHLSEDWQTVVTHDEIWDVASGQRLAKLPEHRGIVQNDWSAAAVSPLDPNIVVTGALEGARVWTRDGTPLATLPNTRGTSITAIDFSCDGKLLAVYKVTGGVQVFDTSMREPASWKQHQFVTVFTGSTLTFSPTEQDLLAVAGEDGVVRGFRIGESSSTDLTIEHDNEVIDVQLSQDGRYVAVSMPSGEVHLWEIAPKRQLLRVEPYEEWSPISGTFLSRDLVSFSRDSKFVAIVGPQDQITLYDIEHETRRELVPERTRDVAKLRFRYSNTQFSRDGKRLYAVALQGRSGVIHVWDLSTSAPKLLRNLSTPCESKSNAIDISPNGGLLAIGVANKGTNIYKLPDMRLIAEIVHAESGALAVRFSPDGEKLATGSFLPEAAQIWDTSTWQLVTEFHHPMPVTDVSWSADGQRLATSGFDATTRLWDVETQQVISTFRGATSEFSRNGTVLAVGGMASDWVLESGGRGRVVLHRAPSSRQLAQ